MGGCRHGGVQTQVRGTDERGLRAVTAQTREKELEFMGVQAIEEIQNVRSWGGVRSRGGSDPGEIMSRAHATMFSAKTSLTAEKLAMKRNRYGHLTAACWGFPRSIVVKIPQSKFFCN